MATLEKIRSKSVFLLVVIFVALLAFILGDAITNGRNLFGSQTTVAKVGGKKIDITEYQRKREELNSQFEEARKQNPQQYASFDVQRLPQMALNQLISEQLLDEAVSRLGLRTSPELLKTYLFQNGQPSKEQIAIAQQLQAMNINFTSLEQMHNIIFNPKANGLTQAQAEPLQKAWLALEAKASRQLAQQEYISLLAGTIQPNDLDRQALYNDAIAISEVELIYRPYGPLDEKKYPVADAEVQKAYEAEKARFKVEEPTKEISFIAVNVTPSEADRAAASQLAARTAKELSDSAATISKDLKKEGISVDKRQQLAANLPAGAVKEFVTTATPGEVSVVTDNLRGFTVVKTGKHSFEVDSIYLNIVNVQGEKLPAKVLAALNSGLSIDSVPSKFSADSVMAQANQGIALYDANGATSALTPAQLDTLRGAGGKYIQLVATPDGAVIANVNKQSSPKELYEYSIVEYELHPSAETVNAARTKLENFLAQATDSKKFAELAVKEGYNLQDFTLTQSSDAIPRMQGYNMYYPDSRQVVRWVMIDGKPGQVSGIKESNDPASPAFYVAAVNSAYNDYVPASNAEVKGYLTDKLRRSKAGDEMVKQYQPKAGNMQGLSAAMGVEPRQIEQFRFSPRAGVNDATVLGQIAGAKAGNKVVLVKGDDGVYAYVVKATSKDNTPFDEDTYTQQYGQMFHPQYDRMLRGADKVDNRIYKFEADK